MNTSKVPAPENVSKEPNSTDSESTRNVIRTRIWLEEAEPDNPFATRTAWCHGYDVYGELLERASWVEMLYLLFRGERPTKQQANTLEAVAIAIANPGPRDASIHAAMCGGVGGSTAAASLIAALAVGAGGFSGSHELVLVMEGWKQCATDLVAWQRRLSNPVEMPPDVWPVSEHAPGFDPYGVSAATSVRQTLSHLCTVSPGHALQWLQDNRVALEVAAQSPLAMIGVVGAAFVDIGFTSVEGEMLYLLLRLPGAAAHSLEQLGHGYKQFPFYSVELTDDPKERNA